MKLKALICTVLLTAACALPARPPQQPTIPRTYGATIQVVNKATAQPIEGIGVVAVDGLHQGEVFTTGSEGLIQLRDWPAQQFNMCVRENASFQDACLGVDLTDNFAAQLWLDPKPTTPPRVSRTGSVQTNRRAFADNDGPWNPLGASLFWALWGEANDAERLDANLKALAGADVDYVRVLGMVGAAAWVDRVIDPNSPTYWQTAQKFLDRLAVHGLRAQITLFGDAQVMMPQHASRVEFVRQWAAVANANSERIFAFEVANEAWQNGFEDVGQLRELGRLLDGLTTIPVALSSAPHDPQSSWCDIYANSGVDFVTLHYDRDTSRADGIWRPVRQPWGFVGEYDGSAWDRSVTPWQCGGQMPGVASNNEPIGPQSSVASDDNPVRIAMAYATTFVAQNAAYVYHTGAGIQGGNSVAQQRGRLANIYDYNPEILKALSYVRQLLPAGMANWSRHNAQWASMPFTGFANPDNPALGAVDRGDIMRAYASTSGNQFVIVILGIEREFGVAAKQAMAFTVHHPTEGDLGSVELAAGQSWTVPAKEGIILKGEFR